MELLKATLEAENPEVQFLINNAGAGVLGRVDEADYKAQGSMVELNVRALTEITTIVLPFMPKKSYIINSCSIASFVPNARMSVYSATKAYVMSFSRSLRYELKSRKINVTAVCPGPMSTEFLAVAVIEDGAWIGDEHYGVVHRVAGDGSVKGIGTFCINWAYEQCGHLRIDTHGDNMIMQRLVERLGFVRCGTIYVEEDDYPRIAYEKLASELRS
jgi:NAD(P)-dependent dehydrogenase (short-subunit alcohol dehydrogenase family)